MRKDEEREQNFASGSIEDLKKLIRDLIYESVRKNISDSLLFSGGLDTSILALVLKDLGVEFVPVCVSLEENGEDERYARYLSSFLKMEPVLVRISIDEAISEIPNVIRILKSFDPAIPNDLAVYFGMRKVSELKLKSVMTGDGSDEIFAGYDYMRNIDDLEEYTKRLIPNLNFNSGKIGSFFGIDVRTPFLDQKLLDLAIRIPKSLKIDGGHGKWILREAFRSHLPETIILQKKRPLEVGSGMSLIRKYISERLRDEDYEKKKREYGINFYGKDHLVYYEIYREIFGDIKKDKEARNPCPNCGSDRKSNHCKVCGYFEES